MSSAIQTESRLVAVGTEFAGRYRIEGLLGQGGSGSVYSAFDIAQERQVALKVLASEVLADDAGLARFRREADLAQRLSHPNVVRIFDFGRAPTGAAYIVLELVRGQTLGALLRASGPLPPDRVARIGSQVLKGLMEAHALGIVHRDIKPSNVQVSDFPGEPDFVKILDFGIAKTPHLTGDTTGMTQTGHLIGTPAYMSPEQVLGWPIGPPADLYAVGLVLAEMITGRPVYAGGTAFQILMAQASPAPVPLPAEVLASPFAGVIQRATLKEPARRYGAASEMLADVLSPSGARASLPALAPLSAPTSGPPGSGMPVATIERSPGGAALPFAGGTPPLAPIYAPGAPARSSSVPIAAAVGGVFLVMALAIGAVLYLVLGKDSASSTIPSLPVIAGGAAPGSPASTGSAAGQATARGAATGAAATGGASQPGASTAHAPGGASPSSNLPMCLDMDTRQPVQAATPGAAASCNSGPPYGDGVAYVTFEPSTGVAVAADVVIQDAGHSKRIRNPGVEACMKAILMKVHMKPCSWNTTVQGNASFNLPAPAAPPSKPAPG